MIFNTWLFWLGVLFWQKTWVSRFGVSYPGVSDKFYTLKDLFNKFIPDFSSLDPKVWIERCGTDGFIYLYYQRMIIKMLLIFSAIALLVSIPVNWTSSSEENFFTRTTLSKSITDWKAWFQVIIVAIFSGGVLLTVYLLRSYLSEVLMNNAIDLERSNEHEWLRMRTVHVRGLDIGDRSGGALARILQAFLQHRGGGVVEVYMVPDYQKLLELEIERQTAMCYKRILEDGNPRIEWRRRFLRPENFEEMLAEIEAEMEEVTKSHYWNSGHAFVVFSSLEAAEKCLYNFRPGFNKAIMLGIRNLAEKYKTLGRLRAFSTTFRRFEDDREIEHKDILVEKAVNPYDINWVNVGGTRGIYFFRRITLLTGATLVLLFLTTPASLLAALREVDYFGIFTLSWAENFPSPIKNTVEAYLPSAFILLLNQILLVLIDISAYLEKNFSHTQTQLSILHRAVFYLTMNMMIIPTVTLATATSLINVLTNKEFLLADILGQMHLADSGAFFVNLLLQKSCFSSIFYLLRVPEVLSNYGSMWIAYSIREDLNSHDKWRRQEGQVFQYGYFYSLMLTGFAIIMTFCSTVPLVIPAGCWFFIIKHFVDGLALMTVHRKEIESEGRLLKSVINYTLLCVLFYQASMIGFFSICNLNFQAFIVLVMFIMSMFFSLSMSGPVFDLSSKDEEYFCKMNSISQESVKNWRKIYSNPLALYTA